MKNVFHAHQNARNVKNQIIVLNVKMELILTEVYAYHVHQNVRNVQDQTLVLNAKMDIS